jgi:hypothetical protein
VLASGRRLGDGALVGRVSQRSLLLTSAQTGGGTSVRDDGTGLAVVELFLQLYTMGMCQVSNPSVDWKTALTGPLTA